VTTLILAAPALGRSVVTELLERQRLLTLFGLASLVLALPVIGMIAVDPRLLHGVSVWVKPAKFLVSVGVFALTAAWFYGFVRPDRRASRRLRWSANAIVWAGGFELAYIAWQAGQGLDSHFNTGTIFHAIMYGLMGLSAVLLVGTALPLAWEIARRPAPGLSGDLAAAVAIGLVLTFLLGGGLGGYMSAGTGHSVGAEGGRFPVFGWNRLGGDLRVAHFFGIHAEQAIPLIAVAARPWQPSARWTALALGTALYVAATLAIFFQAVAGRPFLAL
jgi:hypothetical protein